MSNSSTPSISAYQPHPTTTNTASQQRSNVRVQYPRVLGKGVDEFDINGVPRTMRLDSTPTMAAHPSCAPLALSDDDGDQHVTENTRMNSSATSHQSTPPALNRVSTPAEVHPFRRNPPSIFINTTPVVGSSQYTSISPSLPFPHRGHREGEVSMPSRRISNVHDHPESEFYRTATSAPLPSPPLSPERHEVETMEYFCNDDGGASTRPPNVHSLPTDGLTVFEEEVAFVADGLGSSLSSRRRSSQTNPSFASNSTQGKTPARESWKWFKTTPPTTTGTHESGGSVVNNSRRNTVFIEEGDDTTAHNPAVRKQSWSRISARSIPDDSSSDDDYDDPSGLGSYLIPTRSQSVRGVTRRRLVLVIGGETFEGAHIISSLLRDGFAVRVWCKDGETSTTALHDYSNLVPSFNKNLYLFVDSNTRAVFADVEFVVFVSPLSGNLANSKSADSKKASSSASNNRMSSSKIAAATGLNVSMSTFSGSTMTTPKVPIATTTPNKSATPPSKARTFGNTTETDIQFQERILTKKMKDEVHELYVAISAHGRHVKKVIFMGSCTMPMEASKLMCRKSARGSKNKSGGSMPRNSSTPNLNVSFSPEHLHCNDTYEMAKGSGTWAQPDETTDTWIKASLQQSSSKVFRRSGSWFIKGMHRVATTLGPYLFDACQNNPTDKVTRRISQALDCLHLDHTETSEIGEMVVRARAAAVIEARKTSTRLGIHTVFMLPSIMVGPPLTSATNNALMKLQNVVTGKCALFSRVPKLYHNFVDVRDVGRWVSAALDHHSTTPGKEYVLTSGEMSLSNIGKIIHPHFTTLTPVVSDLPNFLTLLFSVKWFGAKNTLGLLQRHVGFSCPMSVSSAALEFGIPHTPLTDTFIETTASITNTSPEGYTPTTVVQEVQSVQQGMTTGLLSFSAPATPNVMGSSHSNHPFGSVSGVSNSLDTPILQGGSSSNRHNAPLFTVFSSNDEESPLSKAQVPAPLPYDPPTELTALPPTPDNENLFNVRTVLPIFALVSIAVVCSNVLLKFRR